jgi:UDP-N-acetyl-D-mannosaminuronic acid transferase (WecB/TagA/CpsF family)
MNDHWLDAAAMLNKAARDLKHAAEAEAIKGTHDDRTQGYLKSALHNVTAAIARFEADVVR